MRVFLLFLLLACRSIFAQPSPITFTMQIGSPSSITCTHSFVTITLQSEYTVSPVSYSWTNGLANYTGSVVNVSSPGNYSITATASPSLSLTYYLNVPINTITPTSMVTPLSQTITCALPNATVNASSTLQFATHYFMPPVGGTFVATAPTTSYSPSFPGTYTHVVVNELTGCKTQDTFTISGTGFPTFDLSSTTDFTVGCNTKSTTVVDILNAVSQPTGAHLSYTVTQSPTYIGGPLTTYSFSTLDAGNYTVVVKDALTGCESSVPISIIANTNVPLPYVLNDYAEFTCKENKHLMQIIQTAPGNFTFGWSTNLANPFPATHPYDTLTVFADPNPLATGFMSPWRVITDNNSMCSIAWATGLNQDMAPPVVTLKSNYPAITCKHPYLSLFVSAHSSSTNWNPGTVSAYLWEGPAPMASGTISSGYLAPTAGIYTVHVIDNKSGCKNTDTLIVKDIRSTPQISTQPQDYFLCDASTITIQPVNSSSVPLLFSWMGEQPGIVSSTTLSTVLVNNPGIYHVRATNPVNNCTVSVQLVVNSCEGINDMSSDLYFSAYPNPAYNYIIVESTNALHLVVTDVLSKPLAAYNVEAGKTQLDLSSYPPGVYFIQPSNKGQNQQTIKIIKD